MKNQAANFVTFIGIVLAVSTNVVLWSGSTDYLALFIITLAVAATDFMDGQLARRKKIVTNLGKSLDRLRDKLFVCPFFLYLLLNWEGDDFVTVAKVWIIIALLFESGLIASGIYALRTGKDASSHEAGKAKQVLYMATISFWLFFKICQPMGDFGSRENSWLAFLIGLSTLFAGRSLSGYMMRYFPQGEKIKT